MSLVSPLFPSEASLLDDFDAMLVMLEPRYSNIRPGDLAVTGGRALLATYHRQVLTPADDITTRDQIVALEALGFTKKPASFATTTLTFTLTAALTSAFTIPAGTEWGTPNRAVVFTLDTPVTFAIGQTVQSGPATCTVAGVVGNVAIGSITQNYSSVSYVQSVTNLAQPQDGEDEETTTDFLARSAGEIRAHNACVKEKDFEVVAEAVTGIKRARCLVGTRFIAPSTFTPNQPGYVTVLALPNDGNTMSVGLQAATYNAVAQRTFADIVKNNGLAVTDFARVNLSWVAQVDGKTGWADAAVIAQCKAALEQAFNPLNWDSQDGDLTEITIFDGANVLNKLPSVASVKSITLNGGTTPVTVGSLQLPQIGSAPVVTVVP